MNLKLKEHQIDDPHIHEIRREYSRIDSNWLLLHYKTALFLVVFAIFVECSMAFIIINSDMMSTTVDIYVLKFILIPSLVNILCIIADSLVLKSKRLSQYIKIYTVSLSFVFICFVLFSVHSTFTATYYIFALAIILTMIYASYRLTFITSVSSVAALVLSELFIKWDLDKPSIYGSTVRMGDFLVSLSILFACSAVCMAGIAYSKKKNEASIQKEIEREYLKLRLQIDDLTGVFNRKALHDKLRDIEAEAESEYIFAIADLDNFKAVNDNYGHHVGDLCLIEFSKILEEVCGASYVFRYGGDEFCLFFKGRDIDKAVIACRKIQMGIERLKFQEYPKLGLTASFGLAEYPERDNAARLFISADQALYEAKKSRNAIRIA